MSALHAMALPENDPDSRATAICRAHGRAVHHRAARDRAARSQAARDQAARGQTTGGPTTGGQAPAERTARSQDPSSRVIRSRAPSGQTARHQAACGRAARPRAMDAPLRLTRRGRVVIAVAAAILMAAVSLIAAGAVQAADRSASPRAAERNLARVVVRPGQSLWTVAERADPGVDSRQVIQQIVELNGLTGDAVVAGQLLWVPRG